MTGGVKVAQCLSVVMLPMLIAHGRALLRVATCRLIVARRAWRCRITSHDRCQGTRIDTTHTASTSKTPRSASGPLHVLLADPDQGIVLDRSAFYPGGGGQPPDHAACCCGEMSGTRIVGTRRVTTFTSRAEGTLAPGGHGVHGGLDDERRTSLMRARIPVTCAQRNRAAGLRRPSDRRGTWNRLIARMDFTACRDVPARLSPAARWGCLATRRCARSGMIDIQVLPAGAGPGDPETSSAPRAACRRRTSRWSGSAVTSTACRHPRPTARTRVTASTAGDRAHPA